VSRTAARTTAATPQGIGPTRQRVALNPVSGSQPAAAREIREATGWTYDQLRVHLERLVAYAYASSLEAIATGRACGVSSLLEVMSSYGYRPGRNQHDCLDALGRTIQRQKVNFVVEADIASFDARWDLSLRRATAPPG